MKEKYKVLDLFSGLGGFSLGLERTGHFETIAFCDNDKFSKLILDKHWKGIKVYEHRTGLCDGSNQRRIL